MPTTRIDEECNAKRDRTMSTPAVNPIHGPSRVDIVDAKHAKAEQRVGTLPHPHPAQDANHDRFEITERARRLAEAMDFYPTEDKKDVFTKERLREIAERIASGFYEYPEVIEAIVEGYRKEFGI